MSGLSSKPRVESLYIDTDNDSCDDVFKDIDSEGPTLPLSHQTGSQRGRGECREYWSFLLIFNSNVIICGFYYRKSENQVL